MLLVNVILQNISKKNRLGNNKTELNQESMLVDFGLVGLLWHLPDKNCHDDINLDFLPSEKLYT